MDYEERLVEQLDEFLLLPGRAVTRFHEIPDNLPNWNQRAAQTTRRTQEVPGDQTAHRLWAHANKNMGCFFNRVCQAWR